MASVELQQKVDTLPDKPGVYCFRDAGGAVLYVGKAQSLKSRVRSYLQSPDLLAPKTRRMVDKACDLDVTVTGSPVEALILECNLIKEFRPRYNVRLRDDKSYPFIKVTLQEEWPRVYFTRSISRDGSRYFGPFTDARSVRHTLDTLNRLFPFRSCHRTITGKDPRACLSYHIHRCMAPCIGVADHGEYIQAIQQVLLFLEGKQERIIDELRDQMEQAAEELQFEQAARLRDRIRSLEKTMERQKITSGEDRTDRDVIGLACGNGHACAQLFFVRNGKLVGSEHFVLEGTEDESLGPVLASFIQQFYDNTAVIPPQILLQEDIEDQDTLAQWLSEKRGSKAVLSIPKRGSKRQLVQMAMDNATQQLEMLKLRWLNDEQRTTAALVELRDALQLPATPHRIECYDISNIQGTSAVGSMVVFEGGQPKNSDYRRFKIKTVEGANDYAMLQEVLRRRFKRAISDQQSAFSEDDAETGGRGDAETGGRGDEDAETQGRGDAESEAPSPAAAGGKQSPSPAVAGEGRGEGSSNPSGECSPLTPWTCPLAGPRLSLRERELGCPLRERELEVSQGEGVPGDSKGEREHTQHPAPSTQHPALSTQHSALSPQDSPWAALPDLVMVDGGKGQLSAALEVMEDLGLSDVPVIGLAKENEEIFLPGRSVGILLSRTSQALFLVQRVRDEAHRFAITYHRKVRSKGGMRSALDQIQGIGPKRKQALIKRFGSIKAIREASLEELLAVQGMNRQAAEKLKEML